MEDFADALVESYRCPGWLENGHLNTIWAYLVKPAKKVAYRRQTLPTPDGDELHLDWTVGATASDPSTPLVVGCHGLEGNSQTPYMRRLMTQVQARGWAGLALNYRGCSGVDNLGLRAYHSGFTADLELVLESITEAHPIRPIYLAGYSLGASIVANYLGRMGEMLRSNIRAAFLCSTPFLLEPGSSAINRGLNQIYQQKFLRTLKKKAALKGRKFPEWKTRARVASSVWSIRDFDEAWIVPVFGFSNVEDYYQKSSSAGGLREISIPTFALHAKDDPFIVDECVPEEIIRGARNMTLGITANGGHVGFVCADNPSWLEEQILHWFGRHT